MSEDLSKKIKQITDVLSQENIPENLKGLFSLLAGSANSSPEDKKNEPSPKADEANTREERADKNELEENLEMARKVKTIMDRLNKVNDPRINLLLAIKPFLNHRRQKKITNCINLLRVSSLVRLMEEDDKEIL
ncbi:MAG TPA: hypothetical protein GXX14_10410 [Clostridiaceae bacterium]|nr:hypothetical protein [Clostridiaceae bacterium]